MFIVFCCDEFEQRQTVIEQFASLVRKAPLTLTSDKFTTSDIGELRVMSEGNFVTTSPVEWFSETGKDFIRLFQNLDKDSSVEEFRLVFVGRGIDDAISEMVLNVFGDLAISDYTEFRYFAALMNSNLENILLDIDGKESLLTKTNSQKIVRSVDELLLNKMKILHTASETQVCLLNVRSWILNFESVFDTLAGFLKISHESGLFSPTMSVPKWLTISELVGSFSKLDGNRPEMKSEWMRDMKKIKTEAAGYDKKKHFGTAMDFIGFTEHLDGADDKPRVKRKPPILALTIFKSGTKLLEHILAKVTGLPLVPVGMGIGSDYGNPDLIEYESEGIWTWHADMGEEAANRIQKAGVPTFFLVRNVYDLLVSQYYHFQMDVDAEIGHSAGTKEVFSSLSRSEGISLVINGVRSDQFTWRGFGHELRQIRNYLLWYRAVSGHLLCFDDLINHKAREIEKIVNYLDLKISPEIVESLLASSDLDSMRRTRVAETGKDGLHFRKGIPGDHVNVLEEYHYHMINNAIENFCPDLPAICAKERITSILDSDNAV